MKTRIIKYLIICLAVGSLAVECNKEKEPELNVFNTVFTVTPETGPVHTIFNFDATKSYYDGDLYHEDVDCKWDFNYTGEGDILWDYECKSTEIVNHTYTEAATYTVVLEISHKDVDWTEQNRKTVIVTASQNTPPVAEFEGNPTSGTIPLTVYFTDQSTNNPTSWQWDFGSGQLTSSEQNPSYTYEEEGVYTVKLTVANIDGIDEEEKINYITVSDGSNACPGAPTVTDVDGNEYPTVQIGDQCWMKENLKTTRYKDETSIPNVEDGSAWKDLITGAYVWYENEISWKDKYGALYNWYAVDDAKGLCPTGWHVPSKEEWLTLISFIGGDYILGRKLRSCRQVNSPIGGDCVTSEHPRWNATSVIFGDDLDYYGLSLLPGGNRLADTYSAFYLIGSVGNWWSSTQDNGAWYRSIELNNPHIYEFLAEENRGYSVRCLKND